MLALLLLTTVLFLMNREAIANNLRNARLIERIFSKNAGPSEKPPAEAPKPAAEQPSVKPALPATKPAEPPAKPAADKPTAAPVAEKPAAPPAAAPASEKPEAPKTTDAKPAVKAPAETPKQTTRERTLWYVRVETDGVIARVKVKRQIPASETPLADAIASLMAGPTAAEVQKGYSSLIPAGTKLLTATVRGSTAYLSFNDVFQFNSYGIEGYAAQLRQIIWTATEFDTVKDVQILIEGRRVDFLGAEGIFIGSPLGRDSI